MSESASKTVVFRADASTQIGTGHVMRCLTLADALRERGAGCYFICRAHAGHLIDLIQARGHVVHSLAVNSVYSTSKEECIEQLAHASWLDASQEDDANETAKILERLQPDWLIVDHYALDIRWEQAQRAYAGKIMVIDDLADRKHDCDILLDQNWFASETVLRYDKYTPGTCVKLLGPQFALLKPEYAQLRALMPERDGYVRRVLVFLGGSDPSNQTSKVLEALMQPGLEHLVVDVVIGVNHPDPVSVERMAAGRAATNLHKGLTSLAGHMARADLMIGAGGATGWERMCLGLPSVVISIAANQTPINAALMDAGYINYVGEMNTISADDIATTLRLCLANPEKLKAQSLLMQSLVPGDGTNYLSNLLLSNG